MWAVKLTKAKPRTDSSPLSVDLAIPLNPMTRTMSLVETVHVNDAPKSFALPAHRSVNPWGRTAFQ
jgi:hypothetical protein